MLRRAPFGSWCVCAWMMCACVCCPRSGVCCAGDKTADQRCRTAKPELRYVVIIIVCVVGLVCAGLPGAVTCGVWVECERAGGRADSGRLGCCCCSGTVRASAVRAACAWEEGVAAAVLRRCHAWCASHVTECLRSTCCSGCDGCCSHGVLGECADRLHAAGCTLGPLLCVCCVLWWGACAVCCRTC